jgi:electron transport complex protein RnfG
MGKYIRQGWLVLALALVFGVALAGVNSALSPIIQLNQEKARQTAALEVMPADLKAVSAEKVSVQADGKSLDAYRVLNAEGVQVGWAIQGEGGGYADMIRLIVGLSPDAAAITGIKVIYNQETPGLGNKITAPQFTGPFQGKSTSVPLSPAKNKKLDQLVGGEIQAITGATISSKAVCDIINDLLTPERKTALAEAAALPPSEPAPQAKGARMVPSLARGASIVPATGQPAVPTPAEGRDDLQRQFDERTEIADRDLEWLMGLPEQLSEYAVDPTTVPSTPAADEAASPAEPGPLPADEPMSEAAERSRRIRVIAEKQVAAMAEDWDYIWLVPSTASQPTEPEGVPADGE